MKKLGGNQIWDFLILQIKIMIKIDLFVIGEN